MEGSGCFVIDYVLKVFSNWQKTSAAHPLLIKYLIDPPCFADNEAKRTIYTKNPIITKYKITFTEYCTVVDTIMLLIQAEIKAYFNVYLVST